MSGRFVVAGSGRSGTGFASRALSMLGIPTGHEAVFDFDRVSSGTPARWARPKVYPGHEPYEEELVGDASLAAVAYLEKVDFVVHLLRHPLDVLASWLGSPFFAAECSCHEEPLEHLRTPYFVFMAEELPSLLDLPADDELGRAIRWTVGSNDLIASRLLESQQRCLVAKLEDLDGPELGLLVDAISSEIGFAAYRSVPPELVLEELGADVNRHPRASLDLDEVLEHPLAEELVDHAHDYGYEVTR